MGVNFKLIFILTGLIFILSSCRTSAPRLEYQALAREMFIRDRDMSCERMIMPNTEKLVNICGWN